MAVMAPELTTPDETSPPPSAISQMNPADRFLARRFNFLGLPSERQGRISYSALKAELGDDNAAALVTKIGDLVEAHHLDQLGVPLQNAVDRILQSLTPDERRVMAEGGTVPRADAIAQAEAVQAEAQQKQTRTKPDELKSAAHGQYAALGVGGPNGRATSAQDGGTSGNGKEMSSFERQQKELADKAYFLAGKLYLDWAQSNPGLLRLGPAAIQALADSQLKEDGYKRLKSGMGFDDKTIVEGAHYMNRHHLNYQNAAEAIDEVNKGLKPEEQTLYRGAIGGLFHAKPGAEEQKAQAHVTEVTEGFKKAHPELTDKIDKANRALAIQSKAEHRANAIRTSEIQKGNEKIATEQHEEAKTKARVETAATDVATKTATLDALNDGNSPTAKAPEPEKPSAKKAKPPSHAPHH